MSEIPTEADQVEPGVSNLRPFHKGDPRASEAGRRGAETRRANRALARADKVEAAERLALLCASFDRDDLGPMAAAAAMHMIGEVVAGRQKVRDPAAWVRVLVDVARLEEGRATALSASVHVREDDGTLLARAIALRDAARAAAMETALMRGEPVAMVVDVPGVGAGSSPAGGVP